MSFDHLGLDPRIIRELTRQGITSPFPIQEAAIPAVLFSHDVLGKGPTGSGKTFTFGLPTVQLLSGTPSLPGKPRSIILLPTRELANQVAERLDPFAAELGLRILTFVGGIKLDKNILSLARPVDIVVATPGRLNDLLDSGHISLEDVRITVLDEADQMADMGFLPQVRKILHRIPEKSQKLFFSATLDNDINSLVQEFLENPVVHSTEESAPSSDKMEHILFVFPDSIARNQGVVHAASVAQKTIMFARTKRGVDRHVQRLTKAGLEAKGLHGDKGQNAREMSLHSFSTGESPVLVATDIAARGIDIKDLDTVLHIEPPAEHKAYIHRAGRTARAGQSGRVLTFTVNDDLQTTLDIMDKAGVTPQIYYTAEDTQALNRVLGQRKKVKNKSKKASPASLEPTSQKSTPLARSGSSGRAHRNSSQPDWHRKKTKQSSNKNKNLNVSSWGKKK